MKITVKLFATFRIGRQKIIEIDVLEGTTVLDVINSLGIDKSDIAILLVNGRDSTFDKEFSTGDVLSIFPPVGGG